MLKEQIGREDPKRTWRGEDGTVLIKPGDAVIIDKLDGTYHEGVIVKIYENVAYLQPKGGGKILPVEF